MSRIIFKFDKEKDLWNNLHKSNWKSSWVNFQTSPAIREICKGKELEECKDKLSEHLKKIHNSGLIEIHLKSVETAWKNI